MTGCVYHSGECGEQCARFWASIPPLAGCKDEAEMVSKLPPGYDLRSHYASDTIKLLLGRRWPSPLKESR